VEEGRAGQGQSASSALSTGGSRRQHRHNRRQERYDSGQGLRGRTSCNTSTEVARLKKAWQLARGGRSTHMEFNTVTKSKACYGQGASRALSTERSCRQHRRGRRQERQDTGQGPQIMANYSTSKEGARLQGRGQLARGGLHNAHGGQRSEAGQGASGVAGIKHRRESSSASQQPLSRASRSRTRLARHGYLH
jgi:hypothetical protein